jgi:2-polyprenyl-6-methoxyphenol hydroxylase-like FAD-dependent oxidoreductase
MPAEAIPSASQAAVDGVLDVQETRCCVVGGGPGGMILALLLARQGIPVTLLEAHQDFDRQFRGDTLHPAILEILDQIGLTDHLHQLPHAKLEGGALANRVPRRHRSHVP